MSIRQHLAKCDGNNRCRKGSVLEFAAVPCPMDRTPLFQDSLQNSKRYVKLYIDLERV
ncbi:hypothetical protein D3C79_968610 [compost metagenome]